MDGGARLKKRGRIERKGAKEGKYKGKKEKGRREKIEEKIECRRKRAGEEEGSGSRSTVATAKVYHSRAQSVGCSWDVRGRETPCRSVRSMEVQVGGSLEDRTRARRMQWGERWGAGGERKEEKLAAVGRRGSRRSVLPCNLLTAGPRLSISWHNSGMGPSGPENVTSSRGTESRNLQTSRQRSNFNRVRFSELDHLPWLPISIDPSFSPLERISSRFPPRLRKDFFPLRTKNRVEFPHACPWHFRPCSAAYHERSYVTNSGIEDNRIYDGIIQARLLFAEATCTHDARAHPARTGRSKMLDPPTDNHTYSRPPTSNRSITARRLISLENSHHLLTVYCFLKLLQDAVHCGAIERVPTG